MSFSYQLPPFESTSYTEKPTPETTPNLWYHWQTPGQDKEALQDAQRTSSYNQTFKWTVKGRYRILKEVYHYLHKKKLDEMRHLQLLLDEMGLDEMGLDEMGINQYM